MEWSVYYTVSNINSRAYLVPPIGILNPLRRDAKHRLNITSSFCGQVRALSPMILI